MSDVDSLTNNTAMAGQIHYQSLESSLVSLVISNTLHWRHEEMAVGMLLSMITYDHTPNQATTSMWLDLLLSDQRTIRLMAYQAIGGILKLSKIPSKKVPLIQLVSNTNCVSVPGIREDNLFLQYKPNMEPAEVESFWNRPFVVKSYVRFYG